MYTRNTIPPNRRWRDRRHLSLENRSYWSESIVFNHSAVQNDISLHNFHNTSSVFWCSIDGENIHFLRPFLDYRMYSSRGWSDKFIRFKARRIFHMCLLTLCFPILAFQGSSLVVVFTSPRITHSFVPPAGRLRWSMSHPVHMWHRTLLLDWLVDAYLDVPVFTLCYCEFNRERQQEDDQNQTEKNERLVFSFSDDDPKRWSDQ